MVQYIIQIMAFQVFFLLVYDVFLKKETFFNWNRFYLIGTSLVSLILPFIKVSTFQEIVPKEYVITLPEIFIGNKAISNAEILLPEVEITNSGFSWNLETIFYLGLFIATLLFVFKILYIVLLIYKNPRRWRGNVLLVKLINSTSAFSFFHYVFLGEKLKEEEQNTIIKHELVHVTQKHTLDLLFFEVQRILFWFNPLGYMYQARVKSLHEYIADQEALKTQNKSDYYQSLLTQVFETQNVSFINAFFKKSLIKKRIMMLSKSKSKQVLKLKYALLIPMVFGMLIYTSSYGQEIVETKVDNKENQETTFDQLVEKYYQEFLTMKANEENVYQSYLKMNPKTDKYLFSKDQHALYNAITKYVFKYEVEKIKKNGEKAQEMIDRGEQIIKNLKSYEEYLEWKKSDEAKKLWEDEAFAYSLRIFINDINNLTSEEQKEFDTKFKQLQNNDYYEKLIQTDGATIVTLDVSNNKPKQQETVMINEVEVPFAIIEQPPVYEGCETLPIDEQRKCISDAITKHVQKNFNTNLAGDLGLTGRQRISVIFKINKEGDIVDVRSRAPHPKLEEEAVRVVSSLPKMIPGKQDGKAVVVPYSLPIVFQVAEKTDEKPTNANKNSKTNEEEGVIPFAVVEQPPMFPECETLSKEAQRKCTSDAIQMHVIKKFNTDLAKELELTGRQQISVVFKINKEGEIVDVKSRAPHPKLEEEAIRVVSSLPKMIPATHNGDTVVVPYSLPIIFQVAEKLEEKLSDLKDNLQSKNEEGGVPFAVVDELPIYPGCESITSREALKKCIENGITTFISNEFGKNLPKGLNLDSRQKIHAIFKINKGGNIEGVRARAAHPELEKEAIRVLQALPKMIPGKHKGETVIVPYSVPIIYELASKKN